MRFTLAKKIRLYPFWEAHEQPTPDYFGDVAVYRFDTSRLNVAYLLGPKATVISSLKLVGAIVVQSIDGRGKSIKQLERQIGKLLRDPSIQGVIVNNFKVVEEATTFFLKDYAWYCADMPSTLLAQHEISTSNRSEHVDVTDDEKKDVDPTSKDGDDNSTDDSAKDKKTDKGKAEKPKVSKSDKPVKELPVRIKKLDKTAVNDAFVYRGLSNLLGFGLSSQTVKDIQYELDKESLHLWFKDREYLVTVEELRALRLAPDSLVIWLSFRGATQHEKSDKVSK